MKRITISKVLIALLLIASTYFAINTFSSRSNISSLKVEIADLKAGITNLEANTTDLKAEIADLRVDIITDIFTSDMINDIGGNHYFAPLSNHNNMVYMSSKEPIKGKGVWFVVGPNGVPGVEGSHTNFAGFEVWRLDPSLPESYANLEWLEIGSGSPCWSTDDFLIASARLGEGKCRNIIFGTMRTDTNEHQRAFIVRSTDGRDIYTSFTEDIEVLEALITASSSRLGLFGNEPIEQQPRIENADGTLEGLTLRFNDLLNTLEAYGLLK